MPSAVYVERWKAEGRCLNCGHDRDTSQERCSRCLSAMTFSSARIRAKRKGLFFTLDKEWLRNNTPNACPCCDTLMERGGDRSTSPSIDRRDNSRGYEPDNCWVICFACNEVKSNTLNPAELRAQAQRMLWVADAWEQR